MLPDAHVQLKTFGSIEYDKRLFDEYLENMGALRSTTAEQVTRLAYLNDFNLRDPGCDYRTPMDTVRLYHKTNTYEGGPMLTFYRDYIRLGIKDNCGLTLEEWSTIPWWVAQEMKKMAQYTTGQKANQLNGLKLDK